MNPDIVTSWCPHCWGVFSRNKYSSLWCSPECKQGYSSFAETTKRRQEKTAKRRFRNRGGNAVETTSGNANNIQFS